MCIGKRCKKFAAFLFQERETKWKRVSKMGYETTESNQWIDNAKKEVNHSSSMQNVEIPILINSWTLLISIGRSRVRIFSFVIFSASLNLTSL